jgi:hypothetical protein
MDNEQLYPKCALQELCNAQSQLPFKNLGLTLEYDGIKIEPSAVNFFLSDGMG